ncbi:MAG: phytoene/squalene synthase family protein [Halobacteria archaeon]|nr:phytoene/squalene synthase family protein [Halobacteria archaeon]
MSEIDPEIRRTFSQNSTSYYYSSLFFPSDVRRDVFRLYAYVRTADDFVDEMPQDRESLLEFRRMTFDNWESGESGNKTVDLFLRVARDNGFERRWVKAFLDSMETDLTKSGYETLDETLEYIYGSAEVIGLMMCRILGLSPEASHNARMLGRSMQYCNFIRDIEEDRQMGRRYMPSEEIERYGLKSLTEDEAMSKTDSFREFMRRQIERYWNWQEKAEDGFGYIPYRVRVPVILSSRLYKWTAERIYERPEILYETQVKPSKPRIAVELAKSFAGKN